MDYMDGGAPLTSISSSRGNVFEYILGVGVALAVLRLEFRRRAVALPRWDGSLGNGGKLIRMYAPEAAGLVACLGLAAVLRVSHTNHTVVDEKTWAEIMRQWPILLTADTLLSLQSMLRLLVLFSSALRVGDGVTPLSHETAAILCGAMIGRVALASRCDAYMLDGPLGGYLPVACEALSIPLLAKLSRGIHTKPFVCVLFTLFAVALIAHRNHLALAKDTLSDKLFVFAHLAELIASFAYLSRELFLDHTQRMSSVAMRFAHVIMPVQQCLAAYYFVQAFEFAPALVAAGSPFEILQVGGVVQLSAYSAAAVLHLAECAESSMEDTAGHHAEESDEDTLGEPFAETAQ